MHITKRGFTLIELLVVVAIVGLVSSIVIINTWGSRDKARDANIQSFMHQLRNAAELSYDRNEHYDEVCTGANEISDSGEFGLLKKAIKKENPGNEVTCIESADKKDFAASFPMVAEIGKHWCVESAGASIKIDAAITSASCQ